MAFLTGYTRALPFGRLDPATGAPARVSHPVLVRLFRNVIWGWLLLALGLEIALFPVHANASNDSQLEYRVKAAFLLNFCKFVTWPETAFEKSDDPIVLYVLGKDPFGKALNSISGKKAQGRPLEIRHASTLEEIGPCHVLLFCKSMENTLNQVLPKIQGKPVLTVGDMDDFAQRNGIIGFIPSGTKIRFMINPTAAESAHIKISSQLLKLAVIVGDYRP